MQSNKIFIFGGSGSLGNKLIEKYINDNVVVNYSRDECKHWEMELRIKNSNLKNIIGDIRDRERIKTCLIRENPNTIIIASALKHIDKCEYASNESIQTNLIGTQNILNIIEENQNNSLLSNLKTVLFVSTDKACSPINIYGMCKALSEKLMIEKSYYVKNIRFLVVRYGNVLNSRGSIIPILHEIGQSKTIKEYNLTEQSMTRFIMTLDESCELIDYTIKNGDSGDIVIPKLKSMLVKDLIELFCEKYSKTYKITGMRVGEKIFESLINDSQSARTFEGDKYYHIKSNYTNLNFNDKLYDYNSSTDIISKDELKEYLVNLDLLVK